MAVDAKTYLLGVCEKLEAETRRLRRLAACEPSRLELFPVASKLEASARAVWDAPVEDVGLRDREKYDVRIHGGLLTIAKKEG